MEERENGIPNRNVFKKILSIIVGLVFFASRFFNAEAFDGTYNKSQEKKQGSSFPVVSKVPTFFGAKQIPKRGPISRLPAPKPKPKPEPRPPIYILPVEPRNK